MLSGKLFAIAIAILAAAVNASPVEVAKRDANPVRSPCIPPSFPVAVSPMRTDCSPHLDWRRLLLRWQRLG